jgi:integrase
MHFVTIEETNALLDMCKNEQQRLVIALARYGGLRIPSELVGLKWSEVNWDKMRFIVHSPKTENKGKPQRIIPIFPELYPFFREAFESAPVGVDRIFPEYTEKKSMGSFIKRLADRATITLWDKPFQNMRSTRATELLDAGFPNHVVNEWIGHTEAVAMAHYRQITDDHFEKAITGDGKIPKSYPEHAVNALQGGEVELGDIDLTEYSSIPCNKFQFVTNKEVTQNWAVRDSNLSAQQSV